MHMTTNNRKKASKDNPLRVMFVCHGNICRSPMAEFLFKDMVQKRGIADAFRIESAATSTEEIGNPVYPGTWRILEGLGIDPSGKRARQLTKDDYSKFDLFIGMDSENTSNMRRMFGGDVEGKIYKLLEFAGSDKDVADPWYTRNFDEAYEDIADGLVGLLAWLNV